jgi:DNA repair protein RadA/Sms
MWSEVKQKKRFVCRQCGSFFPKWLGRCPECGSWNTIEEEVIVNEKLVKSGKALPRLISEIPYSKDDRIMTSITELDRVLGGGIVPGSLVLVGGDPGIGKSTIMLQMCGNICKSLKVLYVSGEESEKQIKLRADRMQISGGHLYIYSDSDLNAIEAAIKELKPKVVIIDSIQTMQSPGIETSPGSVSQIRESTLRLLNISKSSGISIFIIGHVTKEGNIAGPKLLEHMVDCVLYFEGEKYHSYRLLRAVKNRYGSTNEIGIFEMGEKGLLEVESPSKYLLSGKPKASAGSAVTCIMEGTRPLLVEMQALVSSSGFSLPRRQTTGIDYNRAVLLIAVLEKKLGYAMSNEDIFINAAGGMRIDEPAADLAIIVAIASSFRNKPVPNDMAIIGEVGLAGEVRRVSYVEKRIHEASKLGMSNIVIPQQNLANIKSPGIKVTHVNNVRDAIEIAIR